MSQQPNVILLVLDTVRAEQLGLYGGDIDPMPNLNSFAEKATVYERAYANAPWTLPAHASLFTGEIPSVHGCHGESPYLDATDILPKVFADSGYATSAISNNIWISDYFGFDQGFDYFYKQWQLFREHTDLAHILKTGDTNLATLIQNLLSGNPLVNLVNGLYGRYMYRRQDFGASRTTDDALSLTDKTTQPFFIFVNYMEAHAPYTLHKCSEKFLPSDVGDPERYSEYSRQSKAYHQGKLSLSELDFQAIEGLYNGELCYLDGQLGRLFDGLDDRGLLSDSLVIIVGDHGENIGDHGLMAHRFSVHDTLLHVPMIVSYPDSWIAPDRVSTPVDFRDLYRELVMIAEGGTSALEMEDRKEPIVAEYLDTNYTPEARDEEVTFEGTSLDRLLVAAITKDHKYVKNDQGEKTLYQFGSSDFEKGGQIVEDMAIIDELEKYCHGLNDRERSGESKTPSSSEVERHLEDLGYL